MNNFFSFKYNLNNISSKCINIKFNFIFHFTLKRFKFTTVFFLNSFKNLKCFNSYIDRFNLLSNNINILLPQLKKKKKKKELAKFWYLNNLLYYNKLFKYQNLIIDLKKKKKYNFNFFFFFNLYIYKILYMNILNYGKKLFVKIFFIFKNFKYLKFCFFNFMDKEIFIQYFLFFSQILIRLNYNMNFFESKTWKHFISLLVKKQIWQRFSNFGLSQKFTMNLNNNYLYKMRILYQNYSKKWTVQYYSILFFFIKKFYLFYQKLLWNIKIYSNTNRYFFFSFKIIFYLINIYKCFLKKKKFKKKLYRRFLKLVYKFCMNWILNQYISKKINNNYYLKIKYRVYYYFYKILLNKFLIFYWKLNYLFRKRWKLFYMQLEFFFIKIYKLKKYFLIYNSFLLYWNKKQIYWFFWIKYLILILYLKKIFLKQNIQYIGKLNWFFLKIIYLICSFTYNNLLYLFNIIKILRSIHFIFIFFKRYFKKVVYLKKLSKFKNFLKIPNKIFLKSYFKVYNSLTKFYKVYFLYWLYLYIWNWYIKKYVLHFFKIKFSKQKWIFKK